jgi:hypothetical protein
MSKIRSLTDLQNAMSAEFAWRKKELAQLKTLVLRNEKTHHRDMSIRSAITLLYAHWEGFIKQLGGFYLEFVARQGLRNDALADNFLAVAMGTVINNATASRKVKVRLDVVDFFKSQATEKSKLNYRGGVNTRSNLNAAVLQDIVLMLGLDYSAFQTKEKLIDERLLSNRNHIAHGKQLLIDFDEYVNLHDEVVVMMQAIYDQIDNAANLGKYKC